jgi:hypothetical protein
MKWFTPILIISPAGKRQICAGRPRQEAAAESVVKATEAVIGINSTGELRGGT